MDGKIRKKSEAISDVLNSAFEDVIRESLNGSSTVAQKIKDEILRQVETRLEGIESRVAGIERKTKGRITAAIVADGETKEFSFPFDSREENAEIVYLVGGNRKEVSYKDKEFSGDFLESGILADGKLKVTLANPPQKGSEVKLQSFTKTYSQDIDDAKKTLSQRIDSVENSVKKVAGKISEVGKMASEIDLQGK